MKKQEDKRDVVLNLFAAMRRQRDLRENMKLIITRVNNISHIAQRLRVSRPTIYAWERGAVPRYPASAYLIEEWAKQLKESSPSPQ